MGRFKKKFAENQIAEWSDRYIEYETLIGQMKHIQTAVIDLVVAYGNIQEITGNKETRCVLTLMLMLLRQQGGG